jgi:Na+-transporting methylmalonyl-CoA/oxaloacetate decarboxylase gamma subunit
MEDSGLVIRIAVGGIASLFIVMISLLLTTWGIGLAARRVAKRPEGK